MAVFECEKSSTDTVNNGTMSDDEVVASDVPRGTCLFSSHSYERYLECPFMVRVVPCLLIVGCVDLLYVIYC